MAKRGEKFGKWTIVAGLDNGGQGHVYRATGDEGEPEVAIKIVKAVRLKKRSRFLREIAAQKQLTQNSAPNVIPILDSNFEELLEGGVSGYLVMPLAALSLESAIPTIKGRVELALEVFAGILRGVRAAHAAGIVHRDLKPANILFMDAGLRDPCVADFGICFLRESADSDRLTDEGETVGAKYFMAPEQERGGVIEVTVAADIYALGKLLYHMLTARNLFREECDDAFSLEELKSDSRYQEILDRIIKRTVVHDPQARVTSVDALIEIVESIRGGKGPPSEPTEPSPTPNGPEMVDHQSDTWPIAQSPVVIENDYRDFVRSAGAASGPVHLMALDDMRRDFQVKWTKLRDEIKEAPAQAADSAKALIWWQPRPIALALALGRSDSVDLFPGYQHFLEMTVREDEGSRYPAVLSVPHLLGGFLYMAATTQALCYESWDVLKLLLNEKFEWYYRSGRPLYSFGFSLSYFFHPEALGREASKTHDLYRELLNDSTLQNVLTVSGEQLLDKYLQAQLLLSLRVAQEAEKGTELRIWPDYGRFYDSRVRSLFDRAHGIAKYGEGLASAFNETRPVFFSKLNSRLAFIRENFWSGSNFFWESISEWSPRS